MYCPQCSQKQVSEEMRFCSRCGFPLAIVTQLVRNGGALEGFDPEPKDRLSPRQKGIRWGVILMAIGVLLLPTAALMTAMKSDLVFLFLPVFAIFLTGLVRLLHAYLLAQKTPSKLRVHRPKELKSWPPRVLRLCLPVRTFLPQPGSNQ
jgi:hypothetical protein